MCVYKCVACVLEGSESVAATYCRVGCGGAQLECGGVLC